MTQPSNDDLAKALAGMAGSEHDPLAGMDEHDHSADHVELVADNVPKAPPPARSRAPVPPPPTPPTFPSSKSPSPTAPPPKRPSAPAATAAPSAPAATSARRPAAPATTAPVAKRPQTPTSVSNVTRPASPVAKSPVSRPASPQRSSVERPVEPTVSTARPTTPTPLPGANKVVDEREREAEAISHVVANEADDAVIVPAAPIEFLGHAKVADQAPSVRLLRPESLSARQTAIPVLLVTGAMFGLGGIMKYLVGEESPISDFPNWMPIVMFIVSAILLLLAGMNMTYVAKKLTEMKTRPKAPR